MHTIQLMAFVLILAGILSACLPKVVWWLAIGWKIKNAEPSKLAIILYRVGGFIQLLMGLALLSLLSLHGDNMVMRSFGSHPFKASTYDVTVDLAQVDRTSMTARITFRNSDSSVTLGTGKGESIPIAPGRWAAQFQPPFALWLFDGRDGIMLYEKTANPTGYRSTSSRAAPSLRDRAPGKLKAIIGAIESDSTRKTKGEPVDPPNPSQARVR